MKQKRLKFFTPQDNEVAKPKEAPQESAPTSTISKTGRLTFPQKTLEDLGIEPNNTRYRIGTEDRKRKFKSLFLLQVDGDDQDAFTLVKTGRGYTIPLSGIFDKLGLDYANQQYVFAIKSFSYENGESGYELQLSEEASPRQKPEGGGKRGRKKAVKNDE